VEWHGSQRVLSFADRQSVSAGTGDGFAVSFIICEVAGVLLTCDSAEDDEVGVISDSVISG